MSTASNVRFSVAKQFSETPGPRYSEEGDFSGQELRKKHLCPALHAVKKEGGTLTVDLDGTAGYGTSFLEEAFGGLIREDHFPFEELKRILIIHSAEEDYLVDDIWGYIEDAHKQI